MRQARNGYGSAARREKVADPFGAFRAQNPFFYQHLMIQKIRIGKLKLAPLAEAQIARPEDQPADTCGYGRTRAHDARFDGGVERCAFQAIISDRCRRFSDRQDLGVRGRIVSLDRRIAPPPDYSILTHHDRSHGDFPRVFGLACELERPSYSRHRSSLNFRPLFMRIASFAALVARTRVEAVHRLRAHSVYGRAERARGTFGISTSQIA